MWSGQVQNATRLPVIAVYRFTDGWTKQVYDHDPAGAMDVHMGRVVIVVVYG